MYKNWDLFFYSEWTKTEILHIIQQYLEIKGPIVYFIESRSPQDINGDFALSRCLNGTFPSRKCSIKAVVSQLRREYLYLLLFSFGLIYQCLNRAIPSRKCSIKAPAKWRNSVYVLTEICHQRSRWLGPLHISNNSSTEQKVQIFTIVFHCSLPCLLISDFFCFFLELFRLNNIKGKSFSRHAVLETLHTFAHF